MVGAEARPRPRRGSSRPRARRGPCAARAAARREARAPGSATATVAPAPKFQAPQTICRGSPSPTSTRQSWSRSAFGCFSASSTLPDAEEPEVAVLVGHAAALDPIHFRGRDREPLGQLRERHLERDVAPQPRDRDSQNCVRTRRSPSQSARMSGSRTSAARRARSRSRRRSRSTPRGRRRRSRTLRVDHPEPPISIQPE